MPPKRYDQSLVILSKYSALGHLKINFKSIEMAKATLALHERHRYDRFKKNHVGAIHHTEDCAFTYLLLTLCFGVV